MSEINLSYNKKIQEYTRDHMSDLVVDESTLRDLIIMPGHVVVVPGLAKVWFPTSKAMIESVMMFAAGSNLAELLDGADSACLSGDAAGEGVTVHDALVRALEYLKTQDLKAWYHDGIGSHMDKKVEADFPFIHTAINILDFYFYYPNALRSRNDGAVFFEWQWWMACCDDIDSAIEIIEMADQISETLRK